MTSRSSSSVGVGVTSSSNNDVISGDSSVTDMAAGGGGGGGGDASVAMAPSGGGGGRRFRLLPSLHTVLFQGRGRHRAPVSPGPRQSTVPPAVRPPSATSPQ